MKKTLTMIGMVAGLAATAQNELYNNGALYISNGATLQVNGEVVTTGSSTLTNNGTLTLSGNLTNAAPMTAYNSGTLVFKGTMAQTLGGTADFWANHLTLNNAAGIVLNSKLKVEGICTFTNGMLTASNALAPLWFTANGSHSGTANASHVNGYVMKEGTGLFDYPVGDATAYQPVSVNLSANGSGLMARYVPGNAGTAPYGTGGTETAPLLQYNTNEYWDLTPASTATGTVTVYYDSYRVTPISNNTTDLRVAHLKGGQWLNEGRAAGSTGNNISGAIISNVVSSWSPFTFGAVSAVILPLQWLSLNGSLNMQKMPALTWTVAEKEVKQYEVEKSTDTHTYTAIGSVQSKGAGIHIYSFAEGIMLSGIAYYRIRQTDINGRSSFSAIVKLSAVGSNGGISIYPNPVKDAVQVSIPASLLNTEAGLYNAAGQKLQSLLLTSQAFTLNLNEYKASIYLLQFSDGTTVKVIKQ